MRHGGFVQIHGLSSECVFQETRKHWKDAHSESLGLVYYLEVAHLVRNRFEFVVVQLEKFQAHEPRNLRWYVRDGIPATPQNRESLQVGPDCESLFRGLGSNRGLRGKVRGIAVCFRFGTVGFLRSREFRFCRPKRGESDQRGLDVEIFKDEIMVYVFYGLWLRSLKIGSSKVLKDEIRV